MIFENPQSVLVALLGGGRDIVSMLFGPYVRPFLEAHIVAGYNAHRFLSKKFISFFFRFLLGFPRKGANVSSAIGFESIHDLDLPTTICFPGKSAFPV